MRPRGSRRRAITLVEAMASLAILSFVVVGTATLLNIGQKQQSIGRNYSQAMSDLREGLRRATRAMRHGYAVVSPSTDLDFPVLLSNTSQVILRLPEPTGSTPEFVEVRIHLQGGTLYAQRGDQAAPGTPLVTGVQSVVFSYYQTTGTTRSNVTATPLIATEVAIAATAVRGPATTQASALVALRNRIVGP